MVAVNRMLCGRLFQLLLIVIIASAAGCKVWPEGDEQSDLGPKIGLEMTGGWQRLKDGKNQNDQVVYTKSVVGYGIALYSLAWGMEADQFFFEPAVYLGSGVGRIDNGKLGGLAEAEFDEYEDTAIGGGFKSRIAFPESMFRVGLDARYVQYDGESDFEVDGAPALNEKYDAETRHMEILAVVDYNDAHYRPFIAGGISTFLNEFESKANPGERIEIDPKNPFGLKVGIEFHHIGNTGFSGGVDLGYFGGAQIKFSIGYRF